MKTINEENILGETHYFREEFLLLKNRLKLTEEKAEEEAHRASGFS